jgi:mevalonate kinase
MPSTIHVSAPGKLMLLGEHAVVHGRPCLVTAMDSRLHMALTRRDDDRFTIDAPDVGAHGVTGRLADALRDGHALAPGTRFIESALRVYAERIGLESGVAIATRSDFSSQWGLGSSSATVACTLFGLARLQRADLAPLRLFELGLEAIRRAQGTGSGFDLAAAIFGGTLYYENAAPCRIEPLNAPGLPLVAAYSGVKADTATYIGRVNARLAAHPEAVEHLFEATRALVIAGRQALLQADWARLGDLLDVGHGLAHALGVDIPQTAALVFAARAAGACGAKLSGAGGGDCVIALATDDRRADVELALEAGGGTLLRAAPNALGVRVEVEVSP